MKTKYSVIAIDGYSSCGKSTLARTLAQKIGFTFIDSGAMYRAVTLYMLQNNIYYQDIEALKRVLGDICIDIVSEGDTYQVWLNGVDVSEAIRQMDVSQSVSEISAIKEVREAMVLQQQGMGKTKNIVMDGRDIGTAVFPQADLKIFMTASPAVRTQRRYAELKEKGIDITIEEVRANLEHRDRIDTTRAESPLVQAADAVLLDNSEMNRDEQFVFVMNLLKRRNLI